MISRNEAAKLLKEFSVLLELTEEDSFRARTFANAARQLELQSESMEELIESGKLRAIRGIGRSTQSVIQELANSSSFAELEAARDRVPEGVLDLLRIEGLGPKKAKTLWKDARISSIDELESAIREQTLPKLPGLGAKTLEKFLLGIDYVRRQSGRHLRHAALAETEYFSKVFARIDGVAEVFVGGSIRRGNETVGDIDLILVADDKADEILEKVLSEKDIQWGSSEGKILSGRTIHSLNIELSIIPSSEAAYNKLIATGSKAHLKDLATIARQRGLVLDSAGLKGAKGELLEASTEAELYHALGLAYVPAPLREAGLVFRTSTEGDYPASVQLSDFRGILHNHTTASDGHNSLREIAQAMIGNGYEFLGIADHSQVAAYANGLSPERVMQQWAEIDKLNEELTPFRILKGTEVDIMPDGTLDFDDELLVQFDYVVASIHSGFKMSIEAATDRICRALENPHVDILGHPTGRLLLKREGYQIDHEKVIACAAEQGKAIELNANPLRLDLDWRWLRRCIELEVPVPINPDAHSIVGLQDIRYGVDAAAKGPLPPRLCPSCWSADEFLDWCRSHA